MVNGILFRNKKQLENIIRILILHTVATAVIRNQE